MAECLRDTGQGNDPVAPAGLIEIPYELLQRLLNENDLAARDLRLASMRRPDQSPLLDRAERLKAATDNVRRALGIEAVQGTVRSINTVELPDVPSRKPSL